MLTSIVHPCIVVATATTQRKFTCFLNPLAPRPVARFFANDQPQDFTARTLGRALRKARRAAGRSTAVIA